MLLSSSSRKNHTAKKFKIWQFLNRFHLLLITSHTHSLCVARCGQNTVDVWSFKHPLAHEERCWREWPTQWHRCVNEKNRIITLLNDSSTASWLPNFLSWLFKCFNQLNSSRHVKGKILLDASEASSFKIWIQLWIHRIENGRISAFLALNAFAEEVEIDLLCICQIFLRAFLHLSAMDRYIPSHNHTKTFNWLRSPFEVPELHVHCEVDCIAGQLIELQSRQL